MMTQTRVHFVSLIDRSTGMLSSLVFFSTLSSPKVFESRNKFRLVSAKSDPRVNLSTPIDWTIAIFYHFVPSCFFCSTSFIKIIHAVIFVYF